MKRELSLKGVKNIIEKGCSCNNSMIYNYSLPFFLDETISKYLEPYGKSALSFEKNAMIKIETKEYSIVAIKRLKNIKITIKNSNSIIEEFENSLLKWIESRK